VSKVRLRRAAQGHVLHEQSPYNRLLVHCEFYLECDGSTWWVSHYASNRLDATIASLETMLENLKEHRKAERKLIKQLKK
jgi:hypothetical protein